MSQTQDTQADRPDEVQVLEFSLGDETYALNIEYIEEIAHVGELTPIPNSPPHITGVMDLRGRTTSVVDPKLLFDIEGEGEGKRILVFDPDQLSEGQAIGWSVDEVHQVVTATTEDVDEAPGTDMDGIKGVLKRDGEFVIWVDPEGIET
jgi:purine-binding chemotaxis protein CheW